MSQELLDLAAVPSTQLELDEFGAAEFDDYADYDYADYDYDHDYGYSSYPDSASPEPASIPGDSDSEDPPSRSSSPPMPPPAIGSLYQHTATQQTETWDQYCYCPFPDGDDALEVQLPKGLIIAHRFQVCHIIGRGSFGCTYKALDTHDNNAEVSVAC